MENQKHFSDSEAKSPSSIEGKRRIRNSYINKPARLYNWKQPIRLMENYTLTVFRYQK